MKLVLLSDTHCQLKYVKVPEADVLVHAGDWTFRGNLPEILKFRQQLAKLPHKHKIIIAGNHDRLAEKQPAIVKELFEEAGITYLQDSGKSIDGILFYGSPWQPAFHNWAFNLYTEAELATKWAAIPENVNVLITHGPAYGILDKTNDGRHVGCVELRNRIFELKELKLHVCGHIHHSYGQTSFNGIVFVNASNCAEDYVTKNAPVVMFL